MRALLNIFRVLFAILIVSIFLFPIFWWMLNSIKPLDAIFEYRNINWFDFSPTFFNYEQTIFNQDTQYLSSRYALLASLVVAFGSTIVALTFGIPAAFALSRKKAENFQLIFVFLLFQRLMPSIVIVVPLVLFYHKIEIYDTFLGLILAHSSLNTPFVILFIKSFIDEIPIEIGEAATIDGATAWDSFLRIYLPITQNVILTAAVLCFLFSWTEFIFGLFLTSYNRLLPIQMALSINQSWGFTSAISMIGLVPAFILILFVQRYLVRGLTMGLDK